MAASKSTFLKNKKTTFTLNIYLWTLAYDLGFFPFDVRPSCHTSVCLLLINFILSLTKFKGIKKIPPRLIITLPKLLI